MKIGAGFQEGCHRTLDPDGVYVRADTEHGLQARRVDVGEVSDNPVEPGVGVEMPVQVHEPVGDRGGQVPAVHCDGGRIGRSHQRDSGRQGHLPDLALLEDAEHGPLHRGGGGGQLVKEQQTLARFGQPLRPRRGGVTDLSVNLDGQTEEIAGFTDRADDRFDLKRVAGSKRLQIGGLADAGLAPNEDRHVGPDGGGEGSKHWCGSAGCAHASQEDGPWAQPAPGYSCSLITVASVVDRFSTLAWGPTTRTVLAGPASTTRTRSWTVATASP